MPRIELCFTRKEVRRDHARLSSQRLAELNQSFLVLPRQVEHDPAIAADFGSILARGDQLPVQLCRRLVIAGSLRGTDTLGNVALRCAQPRCQNEKNGKLTHCYQYSFIPNWMDLAGSAP